MTSALNENSRVFVREITLQASAISLDQSQKYTDITYFSVSLSRHYWRLAARKIAGQDGRLGRREIQFVHKSSNEFIY